jgi:predicted MFS family arabinose efflux permease
LRPEIGFIALASFNAGISLRCVESMLPKLAADFGVSVSGASVIVTSFAFAYAGSVLVQGPLGDRYGKLRVVTIAMGLAGLASLACAAAADLAWLSAMRLLTGVFASASVALGMAYIGDVVPHEERQATIARFIAGSLLGQAVGPLFGGIFTDLVGWRASFFVLGAIFLLVSTVMLLKTRVVWPPLGPGRFRPLAIHGDLLSRAPVRWLVGVGTLESFYFFGPFVFIGAYYKERFDLSYTLIGFLLAGYGLGGLIYSWSVHWLLRRLTPERMAALGGVLAFLLYVAVALAPHWALAAPCCIGLGIAFYLVHNPLQARATDVAPDARGAAVALFACAWALGQALGVAAMGVAVSAFGYAPMLAAFGAGFAALGVWLRYNMWRLRP